MEPVADLMYSNWHGHAPECSSHRTRQHNNPPKAMDTASDTWNMTKHRNTAYEPRVSNAFGHCQADWVCWGPKF
eukprot:9268681-Alexandrium_andersonii.AAC.1